MRERNRVCVCERETERKGARKKEQRTGARCINGIAAKSGSNLPVPVVAVVRPLLPLLLRVGVLSLSRGALSRLLGVARDGQKRRVDRARGQQPRSRSPRLLAAQPHLVQAARTERVHPGPARVLVRRRRRGGGAAARGVSSSSLLTRTRGSAQPANDVSGSVHCTR